MRKNVIALMLVLPLLFIFVVFSSGNVASLGVSVSASGIEILEKPEHDTLRLDLASYNNDTRLSAEVRPANASNKEYSFRVEEVEGSEFADVSVKEDGTLIAKSAGSARVVAVSKDGGYTDSLTVIVGSSKPYDFDFTLLFFRRCRPRKYSDVVGKRLYCASVFGTVRISDDDRAERVCGGEDTSAERLCRDRRRSRRRSFCLSAAERCCR